MLFADDTSILITGTNINELVSNLDTINSNVSWVDKNRLINNNDRLLALGFHHKLNKNVVFPEKILKDRQITYTSKTKFLGVWLNHIFNFDNLDLHAENLLKKLSKLCFVIKTLRRSVNKNVLRTMYFAYFHLSLKYGMLVWGNLKNFK